MEQYTNNNLYAAEEWDVIFNSFRNISLQTFDYDTIYNTMVKYIQVNNPEEFDAIMKNGIMTIHLDMFARLCHSLSYRYEMAIRENYFDTADVKESVIKLAKAFAYKPKRNRGANGLCRIAGVRTTQPVFDANGENISNQTIRWNQAGVSDWQDKFQRILNKALTPTNQFGRPIKKETIYNTRHELYGVQRANSTQAVYRFTSPVNGVRYDFEAVSVNTDKGLIVEESPSFNRDFKILYKNDGNGNFSNNTGFFVYIKEGSLQFNNVNFDLPTSNREYTLSQNNINQTDVWVYELDSNNQQNVLWEEVTNLKGQDIDYENIFNKNTKLYIIESLENNSVNIKFGDGVSTEIPKGNFRFWYRSSRNEYFNIKEREIFEQAVQIPYIGDDGQSYNLTVFLTNLSEISNSEPEESITQIKRNAPLTHYTQDRMINAEDYNIYPQTKTTLIKKQKTVNRTHPGHSRYMDIYDKGGEISYVTIQTDDGYLYIDNETKSTGLDVMFTTNYENELSSVMGDIITNSGFNNYVYSIINEPLSVDDDVVWNTLPKKNAGNTGYFTVNGTIVSVGSDSPISSIRSISNGTLVSFSNTQKTEFSNVINGGLINPNIDTLANITLADPIVDGTKMESILPTVRPMLYENEISDFVELMRDELDFDIYYDFQSDSFTTSPNDLNVLVAEFIFGEDDDNYGQYVIFYSVVNIIIGSDNDVRFFIKKDGNLINPESLLPIQDDILIDDSNSTSTTYPTFISRINGTEAIAYIP